MRDAEGGSAGAGGQGGLALAPGSTREHTYLQSPLTVRPLAATPAPLPKTVLAPFQTRRRGGPGRREKERGRGAHAPPTALHSALYLPRPGPGVRTFVVDRAFAQSLPRSRAPRRRTPRGPSVARWRARSFGHIYSLFRAAFACASLRLSCTKLTTASCSSALLPASRLSQICFIAFHRRPDHMFVTLRTTF